jgi:hypothetical protein
MNNQREGTVMKEGGIMMTVRDGELVEMNEDVLLNDGTRVLMDGTVIMTDGTTRMMMEGESLGMDGEIVDSDFQEEMEDHVASDDM